MDTTEATKHRAFKLRSSATDLLIQARELADQVIDLAEDDSVSRTIESQLDTIERTAQQLRSLIPEPDSQPEPALIPAAIEEHHHMVWWLLPLALGSWAVIIAVGFIGWRLITQ